VATLYDILGVDLTAKPSTLRHAYRKLARAHHPDVNPDPAAHERMAQINAAFETLIDPDRRQEYDSALGAPSAPPMPETEDRRTPDAVRVRMRRRLLLHKTPIYCVSFAPDTGRLITSSFDNEIIWWHNEKPEAERRIRLEGGVVNVVRALPNDRVVAAGCSESVVSVWQLDGDSVDTWRNSPIEWICCVGVSGDGANIAMGSMFNTLQVCRTRSGDAVFVGTGHSQSVTAVAWSPDGRFVATGSADATVRLWSGVSGRELHTFTNVRTTVTAVAISADARYLAVAAVDRSIRIFRLSDMTLTKTLFGHSGPIEGLAFHPSSLVLASCGRDGMIGLWNVVQGEGHGKIDACAQPLSCVAFSPDGKLLAAGGLDKIVRVWDVMFIERRA
jgi:WD40 repeat protein